MKNRIWLVAAVLVVGAVGLTLVALPRAPEWTTSSPEALAEYIAGDEALHKVYWEEAREHYERAYELDPGFLIAKWRYADHLHKQDSEAAEILFEELMSADLSGLTPRERFLIERWRAYRNQRPAEATRLIDEYLERYPNDPYVLSMKASTLWNRGFLEDAHRMYQRLLEINPNWVVAYNSLGYISMMQGRFNESEEYFKSYRFIAPDQANPHDSLGELFITLGRYDEAEESLERALAIKPDFWASYEHLVVMKAYAGDSEGSWTIIERAEAAGIPEGILASMTCLARYSEMAKNEAWKQVLDERESGCISEFKQGYPALVTHLAASRLGKWDIAQEIEDEASGILAKVEQSGDSKNSMTLRGMIYHMQGIRHAIQGDFEIAEERLRAADERISFLEAGTGVYKIYNRLILVETLFAGKKDTDAYKLLAKVRGVNPEMVGEFEESGFSIIGLDRG